MTTSTLTHLKLNLSLPLDDRTTESDYLSDQRLESQMKFLHSIHTEVNDKLTKLRSQYQDNKYDPNIMTGTAENY